MVTFTKRAAASFIAAATGAMRTRCRAATAPCAPE
jgi:hypothetical protein